MFYVLADEAGGIWYHDGESPRNTGKTDLELAVDHPENTPVKELPVGASVLLFNSAADAYKLLHFWTPPGGGTPGRKFNPRPARKSDLTDTVCFSESDGDSRDSYTFTVKPAPFEVVED